jgi:hypothetical protein
MRRSYEVKYKINLIKVTHKPEITKYANGIVLEKKWKDSM